MNSAAILEMPTDEDFDRAAEAYERSLTLEDIMESVPSAKQRKISVVSLDVISTQRPEIQCHNELLIQDYDPELGYLQIVPDNFVVIDPIPRNTLRSYSLKKLVRPTLAMEYVSPSNQSYVKDSEINLLKYQNIFKIPYYLYFDPEDAELKVFHLVCSAYIELKAIAGRIAIPPLEVEVGVIDGWMRFWFRGKLIPLTVEMMGDLRAERKARRDAEIDKSIAEAETAEAKAETAEAKAATARAKAATAKAEADRTKAEADKTKAEADKTKAEADKTKAEALAERGREALLAAETRIAKLMEELAEMKRISTSD